MRIQNGPDPCGSSDPWIVSVPNVWIDADVLEGWDPTGSWSWCPVLQWLVDKTINFGGTIGSFVGTDLLTDSGYNIVKVHTPQDFLQALRTYKGDLWGYALFAHGDPSGSFIGDATPANVISSARVLALVKANGYKLSRIFMMQCYSRQGDSGKLEQQAYKRFKGYKGMNAVLLDWGSFDLGITD